MLIRLRDNKNKLHIKDILDIDFDMTVKQDGSKYYVQVNRRYRLDETFEKEDDAEERMIFVAECRNQQEEELKITVTYCYENIFRPPLAANK